MISKSTISSERNKLLRVSLFITCLVDQLWPEVGTSAVEVLRRAGCEVVFDCAYPREGTAEEAQRVACEGTGNLARAVDASGVERLVTLSSFVVYGPHSGPLDETSPCRPSGWSYADSKIESERILPEHHRRNGLYREKTTHNFGHTWNG